MPVDQRLIWKAGMSGYGLRSASDENDLSGASYALDDGAKGVGILKLSAPEWETHLHGTLETILAHPDSAGRHLLLVGGVFSTGERYAGTFPKCGSHGRAVLASTPLSGQSVERLMDWVLSAIENN